MSIMFDYSCFGLTEQKGEEEEKEKKGKEKKKGKEEEEEEEGEEENVGKEEKEEVTLNLVGRWSSERWRNALGCMPLDSGQEVLGFESRHRNF